MIITMGDLGPHLISRVDRINFSFKGRHYTENLNNIFSTIFALPIRSSLKLTNDQMVN